MSRLRNSSLKRWQWAALAAFALGAAGGAAWAISARGGGDGASRSAAPTPAPIEHAPLSEGWQAVALSLPDDVYVVRALDVTDAGVAVDSAFEITSRENDLQAATLEAMLRVEPPLAINVEGDRSDRLRIKPQQPMRRETAYRFSLVDPEDNEELGAWAFQTESPLRVVQTLPRDQTSLGVSGFGQDRLAPTTTGIELTFSHDGVVGVEERFHIGPPVEGRFETHKRVVVFVPKELKFETLYTVTLDAGVSAGGLTMEEPYSFTFETGSTAERESQRYDQGITFARAMNESGTASEPVLEIYANQTGSEDLPVEVFRYPDAAAMTGAMMQLQDVPQWAFWRRREFRLDTSGLDRVASFSAKPVQQRKGYYDASFVVFPEPLDAGFYLVQARSAKGTAQTLLQVTDLAAYANVSQTKTLVWVNDLSTKRPVEDATVDDGAGSKHRTGADGVALFDTPDALRPGAAEETPLYRPGLITVKHDGRIALVPVGNTGPIGSYGQYDYYGGQYYPYYGGASPDFWSYLYPERHLYRKTDEVSFWGIAKRREGFSADEAITIRLTGGSYYDFNYAPTILAETTVTLSSFGTFEGKLPFEGVAPGYYTLEARAGDDVIATTYVQIENFVKPAYKIDIVPSRKAVVAGESVTFDITSEFFDGSPVPLVELAYGGDLAPSGELRVTTDAEGKASLPYLASGYDPLRPSTRGIYARPVGPEEGEITSQANIYVLPATVTIDAEARTDSGQATVSGSVHDVDFAAFDEAEQQYAGYGDYSGAPVAGRGVTARVIEITYKKTEVGEIYDFIAKVSRKQYSYETIETPAGTYTATTGADGGYDIRFAVEPESSYRVELTVADSAGRNAAASAWVSGDLPYYQSYGDNSLYLSETDAPQVTPYYEQKRYASGENVDLTMRRGPENGEVGEGVSYLFYRAQSGLRAYGVQPGARYSFAFDVADAPNVMVGGVQFNGAGYDAPYGEFVAPYDYGEREIEVRVTADRQRYEPGDEITLSVETRDRDGNGVATEALVSGVDEALLRLQGGGYEEPMLAQLHRALPSGVLTTYVPAFAAGLLSPPQPGGGGDGGGAIAASPNTGGADTATTRSNFRDIAVFQSVRTDGKGRGSVTFTLPDNLTSWRIASRAITSDLRGGESATSVPVGLPFFVEATIGGEYLVSDRPVIELRAFGTAMSGGEPVAYVVKAPSLGAGEINASGAALSGTDVDLPALVEGTHEITIEARSGALADTIVRRIRAVPSRLRKGDARFYELSAGGVTAIEGASEGRTRVIVSDYNRGRYYNDLLQLSWGYGDRVDQLLARSLAQEMLKTYFDVEDTGIPVEFDAALYQTQDDGSGTRGGIALFPYADDDLLLSARVAAAAPDRFGKNGLQQYFRSVLDSPLETRERAIIALFGLAASGAPVLPAIDTATAARDLTVRERLYLGLAALAAGNEGVAREQYRQVMLAHAEERAPFVRIRTGVDQDDIIEATSLAAELGAGLGDASAAPMFEYTMANRTTDMLVELEQLAYLARALPNLPSQPVRFSYVLEGTEREVTLGKGRSLTLDLTPAQLAALDARAIEGRVGIATFFEAPFDPAAEAVDADATVRRVIDVDGGGIAEGDLVQVRLDYTLSPQSLDGCYQITDLTPSGLRPVTRARPPIEGLNVLSPYLVDGQKVAFCAYRTSAYYPAVYWARVVTKGSYTAEPATIQSQQSASSFNFAPGSVIEIR